jgi:dTMP kinase
MTASLPRPAAPAQDARRSVLSIKPFRKLWNSMVFSSIGDWLGLLATTALAQQLSGGDYATANFAIAGVFIARLLPAVFLGPLAGVLADRFDRRRLMVTVDILRAALYISIPIVNTYFWLYAAMILVECLTLFWSPAKDATVPNIVPREKIANANQVMLLAGYGTAPIAAVIFTALSLFASAITAIAPSFEGTSVDIALYLNGVSFLFAAVTIWGLREIPSNKGAAKKTDESIMAALIHGWRSVSESKVIRGLIFGMVGAFSAAGAVIGLARTFVGDLGGGDAAYGVLFGAVFGGLALGIAAGPKVFAQFSRRRLFGASLTTSGLLLILLSLVTNFTVSIFITIILGAFAGITWVTGFTMLGMEVKDEVRGRTFAFVQSLIRITLVAVLAIAPLIAAAFGVHTITVRSTEFAFNGSQATFLIAGTIAALIGAISYHQMKDRPNVSLWSDIVNAFKGELGSMTGDPTEGIFIALEGGEGTGKSTQSRLLKEWLEQEGETVVLSREPGGTDLGQGLRKILLGHETGAISPRAEALLYAADRAHHVYSVITPALDRGDVVITDRYFDSSIAYQGAGRVLSPSEVARISRWATESLFPTLTIVIDQPAEVGLARLQSRDRLEAEPLEFHERVRQEFLQIASEDPERYLIVDGTKTIDEIHEEIITRVAQIPTLIRNTKPDTGNRFLKPIRSAASAVATGVKKVPHPKKPVRKGKTK